MKRLYLFKQCITDEAKYVCVGNQVRVRMWSHMLIDKMQLKEVEGPRGGKEVRPRQDEGCILFALHPMECPSRLQCLVVCRVPIMTNTRSHYWTCIRHISRQPSSGMC
jgi:hypothetical protein